MQRGTQAKRVLFNTRLQRVVDRRSAFQTLPLCRIVALCRAELRLTQPATFERHQAAGQTTTGGLPGRYICSFFIAILYRFAIQGRTSVARSRASNLAGPLPFGAVESCLFLFRLAAILRSSLGFIFLFFFDSFLSQPIFRAQQPS